MKDSEGLILQGCGGDLQEWVDGINKTLTESGILLEETSFKSEDCRTFNHDGVTCLLFPFSEDVKLNVGKLAMWRLQTHESCNESAPSLLSAFSMEISSSGRYRYAVFP